MKKIVKTLAIIGFGLLLQTVIGCPESVDTRQSGSSPADEEFRAEQAGGEAAEEAAAQGDMVLVGTVMKTDTSFVLISDKGDYIISAAIG
jgi:hypothetical protein